MHNKSKIPIEKNENIFNILTVEDSLCFYNSRFNSAIMWLP